MLKTHREINSYYIFYYESLVYIILYKTLFIYIKYILSLWNASKVSDGTTYTKNNSNFALTYFSSTMPAYCNYGHVINSVPFV